MEGSLDETIAAVETHFGEALAAGPRAESAQERWQLLREANEALVAQVRRFLARPPSGDPEAITRDFVCECGKPECRAVLVLPVAEFERAAAAGRVIAPDLN